MNYFDQITYIAKIIQRLSSVSVVSCKSKSNFSLLLTVSYNIFYSQLTTFQGIYLFVQKHKFYLLSSEQNDRKIKLYRTHCILPFKRKSYKQICNINHKQLYCLCQNVFLKKNINFMYKLGICIFTQ